MVKIMENPIKMDDLGGTIIFGNTQRLRIIRQDCDNVWERSLCLRSTPHPVTVTTRIITFLVGNPYKPSFATVTGWGVDPNYAHFMPGVSRVLVTSLDLFGHCRHMVQEGSHNSGPSSDEMTVPYSPFFFFKSVLASSMNVNLFGTSQNTLLE